MSTLYVLGNGFDIAHKLATKYEDFYNFLLSHDDTEKFVYDLMGAYGADESEWWNEFEENLGNGAWFEFEFENMAQSVIDNMVTDDGEMMPDIEFTLEEHWKSYYNFMEKLNGYVYRWIFETIDVTKLQPLAGSLIESQEYFINFNYTDVLEKVYQIDEWNILHIHGCCEDKNMIMGHGNAEAIRLYEELSEEAAESFDKNEETVKDAICRFYKATFKDTHAIIGDNEFFFQKLHSVDKVKIYGHSLGKVDMPYFERIKSAIAPDAEWYFYVYNQPDENLNDKKREIRKDIKRLHINSKHIHLLSYKKFFK